MKKGPDIDPDRWPDISRVFSAAAALDGPSRNAYLDDACRQDPALRAAVVSLLGAHDNAGSFGESPVLAPLDTVKRLAPGSQLGPFRIESLLGAGGMGEVYRAHDTKLERAVAIKVLPDSFANDPARVSRFEKEARALAALNHPHIGAIYGVEERADIVALVLELVEGPTLAERLAVGPPAFAEVVWIARQLAEGLEAAHEHGIVHRDLKPANIKITPDGNVKILDFGLAKTNGASARAASASGDTTRTGVIVGTAGYMSPEQARGQPVDKRTDIWAFGCVLFEMCAHHRPFAGATIGDAQAAVLEREPDWKLLRAGTPANLVRLLRRCLIKDPNLRLRDIGEARIALEQDTDTANVAPRSTTRRVAAITAILAAAASFAIAFAIFGWPRSGPSGSHSSTRFEVGPPEGTGLMIYSNRTFFAWSPDGSKLAFVAGNRVWVRAMVDPQAQPLLGTEAATSVFWSPDGLSLVFSADRQWKRINLADGAVVRICWDEESAFNHGTWGARGVILLGRDDGTSIDAVPAAGGTPVPILRINQSKGEVRVHWPWFLPDGERFLYTARLADGEGELRIGDLGGGSRTLMNATSNAQWVDPDIVVFAREGALMAQRVNVDAARPLAEPFPIAARAMHSFTTSFAAFSASRTGSVAYYSFTDTHQLVWADRNGNEVGTISRPSTYESFSARLSRDDSALLVARRRPGLLTYDIWRMNLGGRPSEDRLTSNRGDELSPVWSDDGRAILFAGGSFGSLPHLFRKDLATVSEEMILPLGNRQLPMDVFPDGRVIYVEQVSRAFRMFHLPLARGASPTQLPLPQLNTISMRLSPDGRAMTFVTGRPIDRMNVYVSTVQLTSPPIRVAELVSSPARWSRDGRRIYYVIRDCPLPSPSPCNLTMMTRTVRTVPRLTVGEPEPLFKLRPTAYLQDVARDGRFVLLVDLPQAGRPAIAVWTAAIASTQR